MLPTENARKAVSCRGFQTVKNLHKTNPLHTTVEGGENMIFDRRDFEVLRLCGLCRYLPTRLRLRFDSPLFSPGVFVTLRNHKLIKMQSDRSSYKLTYDGREILAEMGYTFPDDARMNLKRTAYKRKLKNALWNVTLHLAGIDIYACDTADLSGKENGYVSSLLLRKDNDMRVLAGTRFLGILKFGNTCYAPYYVENTDDWIIPGYEREIFCSQIQTFKGAKQIRIILAGNSLEELWKYLTSPDSCDPLPRGMKRFGVALEEMGCDYLLVPLNRFGVMQMSVIRESCYRERFARALGCVTDKPPELSECDGLIGNTPYIIALDFNVPRVVRALRQAARNFPRSIPKIICFTFQEKTMFRILKRYGASKTVVVTVDESSLAEVFPETVRDTALQAYTGKEGHVFDANERKIRKDEFELSEA